MNATNSATPRPARLRGTITVPADKSVAQRALILTALSHVTPSSDTIAINRPGEDVRSTAHAMHTLGSVRIEHENADGLLATALGVPSYLGTPSEPVNLYCGNSGTGMRLLTGAAAALLSTHPGHIVLTGDSSLSRRPMERVAEPLRAMGADVRTTSGCAPITISGPRPLNAIHHALPVPSAQLLSAIALAATAADGETTIELPGPARDHTERMLAHLGIPIRRENDPTLTTVLGPATPAFSDLTIPGDISAAAFWVVAASLHPDADVVLPNVGLNPTRTALLNALTDMGADLSIIPSAKGPEPAGEIRVRTTARLRPLEISGERTADLIDELPILAVAMAGAEGLSRVRDARELRVKESDRIALTCALLRDADVDVVEEKDGWTIVGSSQRYLDRPEGDTPAVVRTDGDHRIAMAAAIADLTGVARPRICADDPACTAISYPDFYIDAASLEY